MDLHVYMYPFSVPPRSTNIKAICGEDRPKEVKVIAASWP
jgi:hypothetical protein